MTILWKIDCASDYWYLMEELIDDESRFFHNRESLLDGMLKGDLYSLTSDDEKYEKFKKCFLLPCLCLRSGDRVDIVWVHSRARRNGLATDILKKLNIKKVNNPLPGSEKFWEKWNQN